MSQLAVRYYPRAKFVRPAAPAHPAFVMDIIASEMVAQSTFAPGRRTAIQWVELSEKGVNDKTFGDVGEADAWKFSPPAILLNYEIKWAHTYAGRDWFYEPSKQELEYREIERTTYQAQLDTETNEDKKKSLERLIEQIAVDGDGYLETSYNWGGTGVAGIFWGLGVANIPTTVKSAFVNEKNRAISIRWKCLEPPEGQADYSHTIEIARGLTCYALVIGKDGNSAEFIHYRSMTARQRELKIEQMGTILDRGRLTVDDRKKILGWENEVKKIKHDAKQRPTSQRKLTPQEEKQVEVLRTKIDDLKDSKRGLTPADQDLVRDIEAELYLCQPMKFNLQEESRSLLGEWVDITFQFLRSGYVVIQVNDERKVYENKRITGGVPEGAPAVFADGLPDKAQITVRSDGGKWGLLYGHPQYATVGSFWSQPFEIPFYFDINTEPIWKIEGDATHPGTSISFELIELRAAVTRDGIPLPTRYQVRVDLNSDTMSDRKEWGKFTPELYGLEMHIPAPPVTEPGETVYDSQVQGANPNANSGNRITDVLFQNEKDSGFTGQLHVESSNGAANLPLLIAGCAAQLSLYDREELTTLDLISHGLANVATHPRLNGLEIDEDEIDILETIGNEVVIDIGGVSGFLNKEIKQRFSSHSEYVADALIVHARDAGLPVSAYAGITPGAGPRIEDRRPGKAPTAKASAGTTFWDAMQQLVKSHAPRWQLWEDENGLRFTSKSFRLRVDLAYNNEVPTSSKLRLRGKSGEAGGFKLTQDLRNYYTSATFVGAVNPLTGLRFTATESIPQATDRRFINSMFYTGIEKHYTAPVDENLRSEAACRLAARDHLNITPNTAQGLPPWFGTIETDFDLSVKAGDIPTVFGVKFLITKVEQGQLGEGSHRQTVEVQLAEDKKVNSE